MLTIVRFTSLCCFIDIRNQFSINLSFEKKFLIIADKYHENKINP